MDVSNRKIFRKIKKNVRNKARLEGSIAEAYIVNKALNCCSMYLRGIKTIFNRAERNNNEVYGLVDRGLSVFSQKAHLFGSRQLIQFSHEDIRRVHWYVMNNCKELQPYLEYVTLAFFTFCILIIFSSFE